jgi:hypothetical protein
MDLLDLGNFVQDHVLIVENLQKIVNLKKVLPTKVKLAGSKEKPFNKMS